MKKEGVPLSRVVIIGALPESLSNFRGELIRALVEAGHQVTAMATPASHEQIAAINALGVDFCSFPVQRNGLNPVKDLQTLSALHTALRQLKPDVVLAYTIKPVVWAGLALRGISAPRFFALITGLGFAFQEHGFLRKMLSALITWLYRLSLGRSDRVIFQNPDNLDLFVVRHIVAKEKCALVHGSGVDLSRFAVAQFSGGPPVFLAIGRLLGEKGFREYAQAARMVKVRHPEAVFRLVGPTDPSPDCIPLEEVNQWQAEGCIEYLGSTKDVRPFIADCHVFVLPSYHEGMPRTVLEAMSMGRPILTTDVPGCRETVILGENGWLVPKADAEALAKRMIWFMEKRDQWQCMGQRSRQMAEERFDVHKINHELVEIMGLN